MAPLAGNYEFESHENHIEYLQSLGLSEEIAKKANNEHLKISIGPVESDKVTLSLDGASYVYYLNKETEYEFPGGIKKKATATLNGDILTIKTNISDDGSLVDERVLQPTNDGLVVNSSTNKGAKAVRRYKRV